MSSHRSRTRRKALLWQASTLLLAAGAVGLLVLPVSNLIRPAKASWNDGSGTAGSGEAPSGPVLSHADAQNMGEILLAMLPPKPVTDEPKVDEIIEAPEGPGDDPLHVDPATPPPPTTARANWTYLGSAITPRASRALVRIDQSQKFIRQGAELDGVKLVEVHDDHIVIEEGGMQRRIERAALVATSMLAPPRTPVAATTGKPAAATPPTPTPPPGSAAAALAAAQAAHGRVKGTSAANNAGRLVARVLQLPAEQRAQVFATMTSQTATYEERIRAISELGFEPGASLDERREAVRAIGLDPENADVLRILEDEMNGAARDQR